MVFYPPFSQMPFHSPAARISGLYLKSEHVAQGDQLCELAYLQIVVRIGLVAASSALPVGDDKPPLPSAP
jgi:hypothetical protein